MLVNVLLLLLLLLLLLCPALLCACAAGEPVSRPPEPPGGLGCGLSPDDMAAAGQLLRDFTERSVLPKLEERVARLNLSITGVW